MLFINVQRIHGEHFGLKLVAKSIFVLKKSLTSIVVRSVVRKNLGLIRVLLFFSEITIIILSLIHLTSSQISN